MRNSELYLKYRFIIWPVIVGISSILILAVVVIPQLLTYLNIKNQIGQTKDQSQNLEAKAAELQNIDGLSTQKDLKVVFTVLPTDQDIPRAIMILQDMVAGSGLSLKSTTFGYPGSSSKKTSDGSSFLLNITVSGQINLLRDFLIELQNSPRVFQVESIDVQFQKTQGAIEAELPLSVFYQPTSGELGDLNQPLPKISDENKKLLSKLSQTVDQIDIFQDNIEVSSASVPMGKDDPFE